MENIIEWVTATVIVLVFTYGLIIQIRKTIKLNRVEKYVTKKLFGSIISSVAYFVFLLSFIFNIASGFWDIGNAGVISNHTSVICTIFLIVYFLSEYFLVSKN